MCYVTSHVTLPANGLQSAASTTLLVIALMTSLNVHLVRAPPPASSSSSASSTSGSASSSSSPWLRKSGSTVEIDLDLLRRQGIDADAFMGRLRGLAEGQSPCAGLTETADMRLNTLTNRSVTCNDGTPAGYYIRKSSWSRRWLVFLEGGWYCFDNVSCQARWNSAPHLMSSAFWPLKRRGTGILSANSEENPYIHDANLVYVPYCSSDSWSGTRKARTPGEFSFMGAHIVDEVIKDLAEQHNLASARLVLLAGSSAGGTGVLLSLDRVAAQISRLARQVEVRGITDSGWFLDNAQYKPAICMDAHTCAPVDGIRKGTQLWQGLVPEVCRARHREDELWKCYFGYRLYPTLKTPVFVIQHLFDEAQITADNVGPPLKREQWQYIHDLGQDMRRTLINVSAVFAPACLSHITLTKRDWSQLSIDGTTLAQALKCWEDGGSEQNHYDKASQLSYFEMADRFITGHSQSRKRPREKPLSDDPFNSKPPRRKTPTANRNQRNNQNSDSNRPGCRSNDEKPATSTNNNPQQQQQQSRQGTTTPTSGSRTSGGQGGRGQGTGGRRTSRQRRSLVLFDQHDMHHMRYHDNLCQHHRLDHCAWPQCNLACPKIRNPFTGDEMDFIDLLMQFGIDLSSIAEALGMDVATLQSMDHDVLLRLLIRHSGQPHPVHS